MTPLSVVYPTQSEVDDISALYPWPEGTGQWVRCSMVSSVDGSAVGPDGRSGSISTRADFDLFVALRNDCDVIVVGAGTARTEGYRPPRSARLAVVTGSGRLDLSLPFLADADPDALPLILTRSGADQERLAELDGHAEVIVCGTESVDLRTGLSALASAGLRRVVVEGGPSLLGQFAADGLLDEVAVQLTPLLVGGSFDRPPQPERILAGPPLHGGPAHLHLQHIVTDGATVFLRYLRSEQPHATREGR